MMRRASSAARAVSGMDVRDPEREDSGIAIPTLSWPPDPPPSYESLHPGTCNNCLWFIMVLMAEWLGNLSC